MPVLLGPIEPKRGFGIYLQAILEGAGRLSVGATELFNMLDEASRADKPLVVSYAQFNRKHGRTAPVTPAHFENCARQLNDAIRKLRPQDAEFQRELKQFGIIDVEGVLPILCPLEAPDDAPIRCVVWVQANSQRAPKLALNPYEGLRVVTVDSLLECGWTYSRVFDRAVELFKAEFPDYPAEAQAKPDVYLVKCQQYPEAGAFLMDGNNLVGFFDFVPLKSEGLYERFTSGNATAAHLTFEDVQRPLHGGRLYAYVTAMCLDENLFCLGNRRARAVAKLMDGVLESMERLALSDPPIFLNRIAANVVTGSCREFASHFELEPRCQHILYPRGVVHERFIYPFPRRPPFIRQGNLQSLYGQEFREPDGDERDHN